MSDPRDEEKRLAAEAAVAEVVDGMLVGIGTGSTVAFAIRALGMRVRAGLAIRAVATSLASEAAARALGIRLLDMADVAAVDLAIDGVDEIDPACRAIKGAGGAMLREKVVAAAAARMIAIGDASKRVAMLGAAPVPVEILPFARSFVAARLADLGAWIVERAGYRTDQGNIVLDCRFADLSDPAAIARSIAAIPGALGHGLFLDEIDAAYLAAGDTVTRVERDRTSR